MAKRITLELDDQAYRLLESAAEARGVGAEALLGELVREHLGQSRVADEQIRRGLEALTWFRSFRAALPVGDISSLLEASRADLESRPQL